MEKQGKFIVIEGTDGSGKTTQIELLQEKLEQKNVSTFYISFPRLGKDEDSAKLIEKHLNGGYPSISVKAASILFATDRFDAKELIEKALQEGKVVIADRYMTSNAAHQGQKIKDVSERKKFFAWLEDLEFNIFQIPKPDLTLVLHVPPQIAHRLIEKRTNKGKSYITGGKTRDIYEADIEHLTRAQQTFLDIASSFPNAEIVECTDNERLLPPGNIHEKIWKIVSKHL